MLPIERYGLVWNYDRAAWVAKVGEYTANVHNPTKNTWGWWITDKDGKTVDRHTNHPDQEIPDMGKAMFYAHRALTYRV